RIARHVVARQRSRQTGAAQNIDMQVERPAIVELLVHVDLGGVHSAVAIRFGISDAAGHTAVYRCRRIGSVLIGCGTDLSACVRWPWQTQVQWRWLRLRRCGSTTKYQQEDRETQVRGPFVLA